MTKVFIKAFLAICICAVAVSAQTKLPIITETKAITQLKQLLPTVKNKKPLLVNFWATWCGPCKVEFPELVKIDADYRSKGLNFVVVTIDNLGAMDSIVVDFLKSYESTMPSYLLDLSSRREIFRAIRQIAPTARDGFPLTLLYDTDGKLVYQKNGVIDAKLLRTKIDKVLAVKPK
ncbi:MAG: TlpA disulfide reductase family protein [Actinomycetota bacterium]